MKPAAFQYFAPASLDEALALKAQHGDEAKFLAGGQSLIPAMNFRLAQPAMLIDVNGLRELDFIRVVGDELRVGAVTRHRRVERDSLVKQHAPLLHEAMPHVAHPQIRNRGTVGGSLAHADPAAELPVIAVALGARLRVQSATAERWIDAQDFFTSLFTTALAADEMLVEIAWPALPPRSGYAFTEFARRHGDYAMMGVAATVTLNDSGECASARLVYLNAGDVPVNAAHAAALLIGQPPTPEAFRAAAHHAAEHDSAPMGNVHASPDYQRHLAQVLTKRALKTAFERATA
jgi:carbon-monoxide dehydrogenase medium subunit